MDSSLPEVWDDAAMIEVFSEDVGWVLLNCPNAAFFAEQCASGSSYWEDTTTVDRKARQTQV